MEKVICEYCSNIDPKPVDWLWYPYIPFGKLSVVQGNPGEGKSTFMLNLVALLTTGRSMPDGYKTPGPGVSIYQCAEDGRIEAAIRETSAGLFIVDPLQAFIPADADMQSAIKMRAVLRKLAKVAEDDQCAVILIGHMNKGHGGKTLYRGLGSIDIAAIARSILMISGNENRPNLRYMYPIMSCLAPEGEAVDFSFKEGCGIEWEADTGVASRTVEKVRQELNVVTYRSGGCWY